MIQEKIEILKKAFAFAMDDAKNDDMDGVLTSFVEYIHDELPEEDKEGTIVDLMDAIYGIEKEE